VVAEWNTLAVQCIATATPPARGGPPGLFDLALMHAAMHDAVQAIQHDFEPTWPRRRRRAASRSPRPWRRLRMTCSSWYARQL
jgi:hypothetical protein